MDLKRILYSISLGYFNIGNEKFNQNKDINEKLNDGKINNIESKDMTQKLNDDKNKNVDQTKDNITNKENNDNKIDEEKIILHSEPDNTKSVKEISELCISEVVVSVLLQYLESFIKLCFKNDHEIKDEYVMSKGIGKELLSTIIDSKKDLTKARLLLIYPKIKGFIQTLFKNEKFKFDETKTKSEDFHQNAYEFINNIKAELMNHINFESIKKSMEEFINYNNSTDALLKNRNILNIELKNKLRDEIYKGKFEKIPSDLYIEDDFIDFILKEDIEITVIEYNNLIKFINLVEKNTDEKRIYELLKKRNPDSAYLDETMSYVYFTLKFLQFCFSDYEKAKKLIVTFTDSLKQ